MYLRIIRGMSGRSPISPRGQTEGKTEGSGGLRPNVGTKSRRYGDVPRHTGGNGRKAVTKDTAIDEQRKHLGRGLPEL
jgi:hypothetical protein